MTSMLPNENTISKNKCFVSAVVYVHNDAKSDIEYFFGNVIGKIRESFENVEVIIVTDDDSLDQVPNIKQIINDSDKEKVIISRIKLSYDQGLEAAMCAGDDLAMGDYIFEFDTISVNYEMNLILDVFNKSREGFDIVFAGDDTMKLSSRIFYKLINHNRAKSVKHDTFRIVSRRAVNRVKRMSSNIRYRKYQYVISGLPLEYISYKPTKKLDQKASNKNSSYRWNSGISYLMMYTKVIERINLALSMIFLLMTVFAGAWALYSFFFDSNTVSGWVSLMGVISFGFFGMFLLLMFIVKYMTILLEINTKKVEYIIDNVDKL